MHAANSIRPYTDVYNTEGLYNYDRQQCDELDALTDKEIEQLIEADSKTFGGIMGSDFDVKRNLYGDDYADAMMAELGL